MAVAVVAVRPVPVDVVHLFVDVLGGVRFADIALVRVDCVLSRKITQKNRLKIPMSPRVFFLLFLPHEGVLHPVALALE
jgi:hypothetical protein